MQHHNASLAECWRGGCVDPGVADDRATIRRQPDAPLDQMRHGRPEGMLSLTAAELVHRVFDSVDQPEAVLAQQFEDVGLVPDVDIAALAVHRLGDATVEVVDRERRRVEEPPLTAAGVGRRLADQQVAQPLRPVLISQRLVPLMPRHPDQGTGRATPHGVQSHLCTRVDPPLFSSRRFSV